MIHIHHLPTSTEAGPLQDESSTSKNKLNTTVLHLGSPNVTSAQTLITSATMSSRMGGLSSLIYLFIDVFQFCQAEPQARLAIDFSRLNACISHAYRLLGAYAMMEQVCFGT